MNENLQQALQDKYPKIFTSKNGNKIGIYTGDGWYVLLDTLCSNIQFAIDNPPYEIVKCWYRDWAVWPYNRVGSKIRNFCYFLSLKIEGKKPQFPGGTVWWTNEEYENRPEICKFLSDFRLPEFNYKMKPKVINQVVVELVKEKLAGLRFYYYGGNKEIRGMVSLAESLSYVFCENCGSAGKKRDKNGWLTVLCDNCSAKS